MKNLYKINSGKNSTKWLFQNTAPDNIEPKSLEKKTPKEKDPKSNAAIHKHCTDIVKKWGGDSEEFQKLLKQEVNGTKKEDKKVSHELTEVECQSKKAKEFVLNAAFKKNLESLKKENPKIAETPAYQYAKTKVVKGLDLDKIKPEELGDTIKKSTEKFTTQYESLEKTSRSLEGTLGYEELNKKEFDEARNKVLEDLKNGTSNIPEKIADDPKATKEWISEEIDKNLEAQDEKPADRVEELLAGKGQTVKPEQKKQLEKLVRENKNTEAVKREPLTLWTLIREVLQKLGFNLKGISNKDLAFDNNGKYSDYKNAGSPAKNASRAYNGEVYSGKFGLNEKFYNVREQLSAEKQELADTVCKKFPEDWHGAIYRNALKNSNFSDSKPILLHNLSTSTAAMWIPGQDQAHLYPATHGYGGVGNKSESGATPIGSFELYQMPDGGKLTSRMGVRGLEGKKHNYTNRNVQNAWNVDPAEIGNSNSDARLIRVHQIRGRRTAGCTGLPTKIAAQLDAAVTKHGGAIMERFVSNPA